MVYCVAWNREDTKGQLEFEIPDGDEVSSPFTIAAELLSKKGVPPEAIKICAPTELVTGDDLQ